MTDKKKERWFVECRDYVAGPFSTQDIAERERISIEKPVTTRHGTQRLCPSEHRVTDTPSHAPGSTTEFTERGQA